MQRKRCLLLCKEKEFHFTIKRQTIFYVIRNSNSFIFKSLNFPFISNDIFIVVIYGVLWVRPDPVKWKNFSLLSIHLWRAPNLIGYLYRNLLITIYLSVQSNQVGATNKNLIIVVKQFVCLPSKCLNKIRQCINLFFGKTSQQTWIA